MSKLNTQSFRVDKDNFIRARIYVTYMDCEGISVQFKGEKPIGIVSTSSGMIINDVVKTYGIPDYIQIFIEKPEVQNCECLISYLNGNTLIHSESIPFEINRQGSITPTPAEISSIKSDGNTWDTRVKQFQEVIQGRRQSSLWQVFLSCPNDIVVAVKTRSNKKCFMAFGSDSDLILHSDYLFPVDSDTKKVVIPVEAFWRSYKQYKPGVSQIACYELIRPDFVNNSNVFYKRKISNLLYIKDMPSVKKRTIDDWESPTGAPLGENWLVSKYTGLPVYKD